VKKAFVNLNDEDNVRKEVSKGNYDALLYLDRTGEGWLDVQVSQLAGKAGIEPGSRAAYVLLSAPDFFPSCGQRELSRWAGSQAIPKNFQDQIWGIPPDPLSETRLPANLQLPDSPFDPNETTMTAVVGMGTGASKQSAAKQLDVLRASTLPDDGAGVFSPGWDAAVDVKGPLTTGVAHLAAYGLGSPFPEDAKLCAALSTFWPAVAPDVYRTMSMHTGTDDFRGTVAPLTDEEIGQIGLCHGTACPAPGSSRSTGGCSPRRRASARSVRRRPGRRGNSSPGRGSLCSACVSQSVPCPRRPPCPPADRQDRCR